MGMWGTMPLCLNYVWKGLYIYICVCVCMRAIEEFKDDKKTKVISLF